jgi:hypothetical protein
MLDFPIRSLPYTQNSDSVWQPRPHTDAKLAFFESSTLTPSAAVLSYAPIGGRPRTLAVCRYAEQPLAWSAHPLPVRSTIEAMAADAHFGYLLTANRVFLVPLTREGSPESAAIPPTPSSRVVAPFMEGAVVGFHASTELLYVTAALAVRPIATPYRGVVTIAPIDGRLVCGVVGSAVVRLLAADGREARGFVGHAAPVTRIVRLSDQMFASTADDATVRVWDIRERFPVISVAVGAGSVVNLAGSSDYLVTAVRERAINVFDLRNTAGRAVLGVTTQEYEAVGLHYNQHEDMLAMFGVVNRHDAMAVAEAETQRIFRIYKGFVGADVH